MMRTKSFQTDWILDKKDSFQSKPARYNLKDYLKQKLSELLLPRPKNNQPMGAFTVDDNGSISIRHPARPTVELTSGRYPMLQTWHRELQKWQTKLDALLLQVAEVNSQLQELRNQYISGCQKGAYIAPTAKKPWRKRVRFSIPWHIIGKGILHGSMGAVALIEASQILPGLFNLSGLDPSLPWPILFARNPYTAYLCVAMSVVTALALMILGIELPKRCRDLAKSPGMLSRPQIVFKSIGLIWWSCCFGLFGWSVGALREGFAASSTAFLHESAPATSGHDGAMLLSVITMLLPLIWGGLLHLPLSEKLRATRPTTTPMATPSEMSQRQNQQSETSKIQGLIQLHEAELRTLQADQKSLESTIARFENRIDKETTRIQKKLDGDFDRNAEFCQEVHAALEEAKLAYLHAQHRDEQSQAEHVAYLGKVTIPPAASRLMAVSGHSA
jgi:hypothetical protein